MRGRGGATCSTGFAQVGSRSRRLLPALHTGLSKQRTFIWEAPLIPGLARRPAFRRLQFSPRLTSKEIPQYNRHYAAAAQWSCTPPGSRLTSTSEDQTWPELCPAWRHPPVPRRPHPDQRRSRIRTTLGPQPGQRLPARDRGGRGELLRHDPQRQTLAGSPAQPHHRHLLHYRGGAPLLRGLPEREHLQRTGHALVPRHNSPRGRAGDVYQDAVPALRVGPEVWHRHRADGDASAGGPAGPYQPRRLPQPAAGRRRQIPAVCGAAGGSEAAGGRQLAVLDLRPGGQQTGHRGPARHHF